MDGPVGQHVGGEQVVEDRERLGERPPTAGRIGALHPAHQRHDVRLVDRDPGAAPAGQRRDDPGHVGGEPRRGVGIQPELLTQPRRVGEVVQGHHGLEPPVVAGVEDVARSGPVPCRRRALLAARAGPTPPRAGRRRIPWRPPGRGPLRAGARSRRRCPRARCGRRPPTGPSCWPARPDRCSRPPPGTRPWPHRIGTRRAGPPAGRGRRSAHRGTSRPVGVGARRTSWHRRAAARADGTIRAWTTPSLLYVTQVAPYRDGPAGVHGVLDQSATAVAQLAESAGLDARPVTDVRALGAAEDLAAARVVALFTIGETPWSADQRAALLDARPDRPDRRCWPSTRPPTPATDGTTTGCWWAPDSTGTPGPGPARWTWSTRPSRRGPPRYRPGGGTTRSTTFRELRTRRPGAARRPGRPSSRGRRSGGSPGAGYPLSWCFTEGRGAGLLHLARALPPRLGEPGLPPPPGRRDSTGSWRTPGP